MTIKKVAALIICCIFLAFTLLFKITSPTLAYTFPEYSVTNVIVVPSDVEMDPEYPKLVSEAVKKVQARYAALLGGKTFTINSQNDGDVIVHKSTKSLEEFCPSSDCNINIDLEENGFPAFKNHTVLNTFLVGARYTAAGYGNHINESGMTWMADFVLSALKGRLGRNEQLICQQWLGGNCEADSGLHVIAHELGHAFGLLMISRWANAHPCSTASRNECRPGLDPKFYPTPVEWNHSLMGYGGGFYLSLGLNDSCVNPEKSLLLASPYFGGPGFKELNLEGCLESQTSGEKVKILEIEGGPTIYTEEEITINTEGLTSKDEDIQVIFPPDEPSRAIEIIAENKIKAVVPRSYSGDIIITAKREGKQVRSDPYRVVIATRLPIIERIDPQTPKPGDLLTVFGKNFIDGRSYVKSAPTEALINHTRRVEIVEYSKDSAKLKLPEDVNVGNIDFSIVITYVNLKTQRSSMVYSNNFPLNISSGQLEGRLERTGKDLVDEQINFKAYVVQTGSTPESAEIYIKSLSGETPCKETTTDNWCKIAKAAFEASFPGRFRTLEGTYTPSQEGFYLAAVNVYGRGGVKCSGQDQDRPNSWQDCGQQSRAYFTMVSKEDTGQLKIKTTYIVTNNSSAPVWFSPMLCEEAGTKNGCYSGGGTQIFPRSNISVEYNFYSAPITGPLSKKKEYEITCIANTQSGEDFLFIPCPSIVAKGGSEVSLSVEIPAMVVVDDGEKEKISCTLLAKPTDVSVGKEITWTITTSKLASKAYWRGQNNGISILPVDIDGFENTTFWNATYRYKEPGNYERFVGIQDKGGKTVCTTNKVAITVSRSGPILNILLPGESIPTSSISSQTSQGRFLPEKKKKRVTEIVILGQEFKISNQDSGSSSGVIKTIKLPAVVTRGATHSVPITISYSDKESFSRNIVFRYKLAGTQESGEKALPGEECNPQKFSCFATAERRDKNPELLFCRNLGETTNNRYEWITQKFTTDICQGKEGITATCGNGQGGEIKYWCTGETWVDENQWATIQKQKEEERQRQATAALTQTQTPQGTPGELSCSLWASSEKIKEDENITWVIQSNFKGVSAQWQGTDNGGEINPTPVNEFTNTNYWSQTYPYKDSVRYTRYALVKTDDGRECTTNTIETVVEKRELTETITAPIQNIAQGPKTIDKIIFTIPPYGQERVINQGEQIKFSLPDTGGVPQTIQLAITIVFSDGTTAVKTLSFSHKGNTCSLSNGKCANSSGRTRDGYQCSTHRAELTGCSLEKDNVYPYCYTGCSLVPGASTPVSTPQPAVVPTPSPPPPEAALTPQTSGCPGQCATSVGDTASGQKCTDWLSTYDDACPTGIYDYCFTNCQ